MTVVKRKVYRPGMRVVLDDGFCECCGGNPEEMDSDS